MRALLFIAAFLCLAPSAWALDCPAEPTAPTPEKIALLQARAKDHGMLWRITQDGRSSYLYGTLHVGRLEWLFPGPNLLKAWAQTEVLALEVDTTDVGAISAAMAPSSSSAPPIPQLKPDQAKRLFAAAKAACVPEAVMQALASQPPLMQVSMVAALAGRRDGLEIGYGQEWLLTGMAQNSHRPIVGLETVQQQMQAINSASAADTEIMIDESLGEIGDEQSRQAMVKLTNVWANGQLEVLADYENWCNCAKTPAAREWLRRLNDDRNPGLAAGIAAQHAKGKPVFVGVGALHMTGPSSLPKLLADKGFKVERIY